MEGTLALAEASVAQPAKVPIIEVAFRSGVWWAMPVDLSRDLYRTHEQGQNASFVWDWGQQRYGSWRGPKGDESTRISRYVIDFAAKLQTNMDNNRRRSIRIAWVEPDDVEPRWIGQSAKKRARPDSAERPDPEFPELMQTDSAVPAGNIPIMEVACAGSKWWSLPPEKFALLMAQEAVGYNWGGKGYLIDYTRKCQTSIENRKLDTIRIAWVDPDDVKPSFTGNCVA